MFLNTVFLQFAEKNHAQFPSARHKTMLTLRNGVLLEKKNISTKQVSQFFSLEDFLVVCLAGSCFSTE